MADFVPGSDFIPGNDLVPGISDFLGIDTPGLSDLLGIDTPGLSDLLGVDDWAPGIDDVPGGDFLSGDDAGAATGGGGSHGGSHGGTGTGTGTGSGAGNTTINNITNKPYQDPTITNLTADLTSTSGAPSLFDFSPSFGSAGMGNTTGVAPTIHFAEGGYASEEDPESQHNPEFFSEGGLKNRYVQGDGDGTSDSVPAMLASGEFVIPADVVSALGNGSSDSGASVLDQFLASIREHKQDHAPDELPPDSKGPLAYLNKAKA